MKESIRDTQLGERCGNAKEHTQGLCLCLPELSEPAEPQVVPHAGVTLGEQLCLCARRQVLGKGLFCVHISAWEAKEVPGRCKGNWEHVLTSHRSAGKLWVWLGARTI